MRSLSKGILFGVVAVAVFADVAFATSRKEGRQLAEMEEIQSAAVAYREHFGEYPATDNHVTWFEKLINEHYVDDDWLTLTASSPVLPVDLNGEPFVYELPAGPHGDPVDAATWPVIRSIGMNRIDDNGALDDWDIRHGPNWGYWYKQGWPEAVILLGLLPLFMGIVFWFARRWSHRLVIGTLVLGAGVVVAGHIADPYVNMHGSFLPEWADRSVAVAHIVTLLGLVLALLLTGQTVWSRLKQRQATNVGKCVACGYDLRGAGSSVCPECGAGRTAVEEDPDTAHASDTTHAGRIPGTQ